MQLCSTLIVVSTNFCNVTVLICGKFTTEFK